MAQNPGRPHDAEARAHRGLRALVAERVVAGRGRRLSREPERSPTTRDFGCDNSKTHNPLKSHGIAQRGVEPHPANCREIAVVGLPRSVRVYPPNSGSLLRRGEIGLLDGPAPGGLGAGLSDVTLAAAMCWDPGARE